MTMKITALYVYPIKGLRGIELKSAQIGPQGVSHDRSFMLYEVRPDGGELKKIQLDSHPKCGLFEQQIVPGGDGGSVVVVRYHGNHQPQDSPETSEHDEAIRVPLKPDVSSLSKIDTNLHGSPAAAYRMGDTYDAWFSHHFGIPTILVYLGDGQRAVLGQTLPPKATPDTQQQEQKRGWMSSLTSYITGSQPPAPWITFADVAPLMVASESSLRDVTDRLLNGQAVGMYKFRPNIVVDGEGEEAWAEDFWAELEVEAAEHEEGDGPSKQALQLTGNCVRCVSLNVDYQTGKMAEGELGNVLKRLMKDRRVDTGSKWSPVFGRYAFSQSDSFTVSVGDGVEVTRRNDERTVWDWPGL